MTMIFDSIRSLVGAATFTWDGIAVQALLVDDGGLWTPDAAADTSRQSILTAGATVRDTIAAGSLTGRTTSIVAHKIVWDLDDLSFGGGGALTTGDPYTQIVFCRDTGSAATDTLVAAFDFTGTTNGSAVTAAISASGLITW